VQTVDGRPQNRQIDIVLGIFSSRPIWYPPPPTPSLAGECGPPPLVPRG
jgi:hypothetical protein